MKILTDRCGHESFILELTHQIVEAASLLSNNVSTRHAHIVEIDTRRVRAVHAQLVHRLAHFDARLVHLHQDKTFVSMWVRRTVGTNEQAHPIGLKRGGRRRIRQQGGTLITKSEIRQKRAQIT